MIKIGLTGGIGSGKSYVCRLLEEFGAVVYDADEQAKKLMTTDREVVRAVSASFGAEAYHQDGSLNRGYLSNIVFSDREKLNLLNSIVHPAVLSDFNRFVELHCEKDFVVMEAAILIESGFYKQMDKIIVVSADMDLRLTRAVSRDNSDVQSVKNRMMAQMSDEERESYADFVIINDNKQLLIPQILKILFNVSST